MIHQESDVSKAPAPQTSSQVSHHVQPVNKKPNRVLKQSSPVTTGEKSIPLPGTLLSTARVRVLDQRGNPFFLRVLLDNGSNSNYVTAKSIQTLPIVTPNPIYLLLVSTVLRFLHRPNPAK